MGEQGFRARQSFLDEAEAFLKKGDDLAALALAESRLAALPGDPDSCLVICRVRILQGRLDEARQILQGMEDFLAGLSRMYREMGDLFLKRGMPEEAKDAYRKSLSLNPDAPGAAEIAERIGEISDGSKTKDHTEELIPVPEDFQTVTLAELYIRQGHLEMAGEVLDAILKKDPQQERAAEMLRQVRERIGGKEAADKTEPVIAELSRWLDNIHRLRGHGV
jgi:tetratricopeptide (TPR) repeat protein